MKVNTDLLKPEDKQVLENMGIVVDEKGAASARRLSAASFRKIGSS